MTRVHVCGGAGYAAGEVMRLLALHPDLELAKISSRSAVGSAVGAVFPELSPLRRAFCGTDELYADVAPNDAVVYGGEAASAPEVVARFLRLGARVVDLSAAFRLRDASLYERWYGFRHTERALNDRAVYGLPELYASAIAGAALVANPGCYPTAALLALSPIVKAFGSAIAGIAIDAKSGISGAGRNPKTSSLYAEVSGDVRPYAVDGHRHAPEMTQELATLGYRRELSFVPHVVPLSRGILATCYVSFTGSAPDAETLVAALRGAYEKRPLIEVPEGDALPGTRSVARTARAAVGAARASESVAVVACAIDNLGKGAAAQAVQNLNIMYGFAEEKGLDALASVA